jgi:hypothetical protein
MVAGDGEAVRAVFNDSGGSIWRCSSSNKMTRSFAVGSSTSSHPSIKAPSVLELSTLWNKTLINLGHYL